jgi:hypothetical protein
MDKRTNIKYSRIVELELYNLVGSASQQNQLWLENTNQTWEWYGLLRLIKVRYTRENFVERRSNYIDIILDYLRFSDTVMQQQTQHLPWT